MLNNWWDPSSSCYNDKEPPVQQFNNWWASDCQTIVDETNSPSSLGPSPTLNEALERLDSVLAEFKKYVDARFPVSVSFIEPDVERALFDILFQPSPVDMKLEATTFESTISLAPPSTASESTPTLVPMIVLPVCSPPSSESSLVPAKSTSNIKHSEAHSNTIISFSAAAPTTTTTLVSALTPTENHSIVRSSKGYSQRSMRRLLTCLELSLQPEPPPFLLHPSGISCFGSMNSVF